MSTSRQAITSLGTFLLLQRIPCFFAYVAHLPDKTMRCVARAALHHDTCNMQRFARIEVMQKDGTFIKYLQRPCKNRSCLKPKSTTGLLLKQMVTLTSHTERASRRYMYSQIRTTVAQEHSCNSSASKSTHALYM